MKQIFGIVALILAGCSPSAKVGSHPAAPVEAGSEPVVSIAPLRPVARKVKYALFVKDAEMVVNKTHDHEAAQLLDFLKKNGQLETTLPASLPAYGSMPTPKFAVYCIEDGDAQPWAVQRLNNRLIVANFCPQNQSMILKSAANRSAFWSGLTLLHETRHAHTYLVEHREWTKGWVDAGQPDPKIFCYDEARTHIFHGRLMRLYGGEAYEHLREKLMTRLKNKCSGSMSQLLNQSAQSSTLLDYPTGTDLAGTTEEQAEIDQELDRIFGPSQSRDESLNRISLVFIDVVFGLADKFAHNPLDAKAFFLATEYIQNNRATANS